MASASSSESMGAGASARIAAGMLAGVGLEVVAGTPVVKAVVVVAASARALDVALVVVVFEALPHHHCVSRARKDASTAPSD